MLKYPAKLQRTATGSYMVLFRDIPEAMTEGSTIPEAREMAADALLTAMDFYFEDRRCVPKPSNLQNDEEYVSLPVSAAAKILLLNEMVTQGITASELARRLKTRRQEVNRVIDLHHATKIDTIAAALSVLGRELQIFSSPG